MRKSKNVSIFIAKYLLCIVYCCYCFSPLYFSILFSVLPSISTHSYTLTYTHTHKHNELFLFFSSIHSFNYNLKNERNVYSLRKIPHLIKFCQTIKIILWRCEIKKYETQHSVHTDIEKKHIFVLRLRMSEFKNKDS